MTTETLIFLVVLIVLIGALPAWPYSRGWGYSPTGIIAVVLVAVLIWGMSGDRSLFRSSPRDEVRDTVRDTADDIKDLGRDAADSIRKTVQ